MIKLYIIKKAINKKENVPVTVISNEIIKLQEANKSRYEDMPGNYVQEKVSDSCPVKTKL